MGDGFMVDRSPHSCPDLEPAQASAIVLGHILAVVLAHARAFMCYGHTHGTVISQPPLTVVMVAYTWFG
jgi:hypothetical protein